MRRPFKVISGGSAFHGEYSRCGMVVPFLSVATSNAIRNVGIKVEVIEMLF